MTGAEVSIIGSNGFIGSSLVSFLQKENKKLQLFESESTYIDDFGQLKENIANSEIIVWCASKVNPISAQSNSELVEDEIEIWKNFVKYIARNSDKYPELIFLSTGGCIYSGENPPFSEDAEANGSNVYGKMKSDMEKILITSGLKYKILRVANVYGLGQPSGRGQGVIAEWINKIKNSEPIEIFGNEESYRDYIHVNDLCLAIYNCLTIEGSYTLNIGSGKPTSLYEILQLIRQYSGINFDVNESKARSVDRNSYWLDTSNAQKLLNWKPTISLQDGIRDILNLK